ncbi:hypothetical protein BGZ96_008029 [Linnemannia gamsii]|uniref:AAA+ ATPase domain-containing protein n=1 Tax=Linnemannia gamsii TaxID=64522 RepID=A0ABQ7JZA6_9FUNG|nr:hypothetical protein BGZ96_008029 [Linnemannia gamsii]
MADAVVPPATTTTGQGIHTDHGQSSTNTQSVNIPLSMTPALTSDPGVIQWVGPSPSTTDATIFQTPIGSTLDSPPQDAGTVVSPASVPTEETQQQQQETEAATEAATTPTETATATAAPPKQVFSLFLTPEQRKKKQEAEAAAKIPGKRGRKPKNKLPLGPLGTSLVAGSTTVTARAASTTGTNPKPPVDPKTIVDPNISKTGETHRFFQEVKSSQLSVTGVGSASSGSTPDGAIPRVVRRYNSKPQESPFPLRHQQFHGSETIDAINGVVAQLSGLDTSVSSPVPQSSASLQQDAHINQSISDASKNSTSHGWYSLRTGMDLGITAPDYKPNSRGKDNWTHWSDSKEMRWCDWSDKSYRLSRPTAKERMILSQPSQPDEFESCRRVGVNERLWHQTWATTLLSTAGIEPGAVDIPGELKYGELWTEKYRPNEGVEVLGNRMNTEYLTQWLKRLEVSGWTLNPEEASASAGGGSGSAGVVKKGSDIMGAARKRRKRAKRKDMSDLDDFIVYDDLDDFEEPYGYQSDEEDGEFKAQRPLTSFSLLANLDPMDDEYGSMATKSKMLPKKFEIKSNTILLSGPAGSCKTAAVYACAEESGYEVFEVSPGMRRTGKEVLGLVGEMAENHHVHVIPGKSEIKEDVHSIMSEKSQDSPAPTLAAPKSTLHSFFQQNKKVVQDEDEIMEEAISDEDVDIDGIEGDYSPAAQSPNTQQTRSSPSSTSTSTPSAAKEADEEDQDQGDSLAHHEDTLSDLYSLLSTTNPRQSLILLEEVDILFEDDKGFWASIVALLSKSRRPVVMTCNDTSKIPASMIRFQEHLEFTRPGMRELHLYLTAVCRIEGYICSSEYVMGVIKQNRYDVRKSLMQLQYDSGVVKNRSQLSKSSSPNTSASSRGDSSSPAVAVAESSSSGVGIVTPASPTPGSPMRRKPQRLMRISAKSIIPASAPTLAAERKKPLLSPMQELDQLEVQLQYADTMSLSDSCLRMRPDRILQCYEGDQFAASKDDVVGQYFQIFKRPSGTDHLLMDQEIAALVEEGCESLYLNLCGQQGLDPVHVFETSSMDPIESMTDNFVPKNNDMSRLLLNMQPALENTVALHGLRFNLGVTFGMYAPLIRSMVQADSVNTVVPTGKRTMRSDIASNELQMR